MADLPSKFRSSTEYDQWLVDTSREAIRRSRELLERTELVVRNSGRQTLALGEVRAHQDKSKASERGSPNEDPAEGVSGGPLRIISEI
ncbi:hypothetical protein [Methylobacterium sp. R2-1]|uniref:hypothetical protein n=1 Tax=Methylobacterium sp. R2-1 TaxID=2587064 RepID=UPI00161695FC|nr:hypothetical protein [Methylobacterium sp. R2-1]MBB2964458.1 hypothetical protein [Methylobacterium sp. R2-1]